MKKTILILSLVTLTSCQTQNISKEDKSKVINKLEDLMTVDQKYAGIPSNELIEKYGNEKAWEIFKNKRDSIATVNQLIVKKIFNKYGFIGENNFNKSASNNFWLIVQHADNDIKLQKKVLKVMYKETKNNNASKINYAMLEDRVNVNNGKKQKFGSQVTYNKIGQAIPVNGLIDSLNIEKIRAEFGLPSFKKYYNEMTKMHFEMNKDIYISRGITEPKFYK
ncbi:DUF6624 domain-containing protein [Faecalibacter rhinopitheci]|uniref:Lipoprotein n=1 Tax=Faecalibacter rhinopitheci TaxID=2779678 RepID=A0A8J7GA17_9FLAO|nr:DUF6624 domain-containing protein [Faecalibacter rhinopitheci]MBF0598310.1 hypothetical protein [Faecalibacter rhinopitheci]